MDKKSDYQEFIREIEARSIKYLIHFTPTINLMSMLELGRIYSRSKLESLGKTMIDLRDYVEFTDSIRMDDKAYINLSIEHPNSFLFNRFRQKTADNPYITWCVLKINAKYIYHKETLFSVTNAANSYNRSRIGITGDIMKFRMLFSPTINIVTSYTSKVISRGTLKKHYPTDEQAEVLVKGEIPVEDIISVCFMNDKDLASAKAAICQFDTSKFIVEESLFSNNRN